MARSKNWTGDEDLARALDRFLGTTPSDDAHVIGALETLVKATRAQRSDLVAGSPRHYLSSRSLPLRSAVVEAMRRAWVAIGIRARIRRDIDTPERLKMILKTTAAAVAANKATLVRGVLSALRAIASEFPTVKIWVAGPVILGDRIGMAEGMRAAPDGHHAEHAEIHAITMSKATLIREAIEALVANPKPRRGRPKKGMRGFDVVFADLVATLWRKRSAGALREVTRRREKKRNPTR